MDQYVLNKKTGTLHLCNACYNSKGIKKQDNQFTFYKSYDDAIKGVGRYKKDCKICFKGK